MMTIDLAEVEAALNTLEEAVIRYTTALKTISELPDGCTASAYSAIKLATEALNDEEDWT